MREVIEEIFPLPFNEAPFRALAPEQREEAQIVASNIRAEVYDRLAGNWQVIFTRGHFSLFIFGDHAFRNEANEPQPMIELYSLGKNNSHLLGNEDLAYVFYPDMVIKRATAGNIWEKIIYDDGSEFVSELDGCTLPNYEVGAEELKELSNYMKTFQQPFLFWNSAHLLTPPKSII